MVRLKDLIGLEIKTITMSENELCFVLDDKMICYYADGDCCSSSYIESIDNSEIFNDAVMLDVECIDGGVKGSRDEDDVVHKWTFYKFKTTKGMATLSFRNDSNGYYNGSLEFSRIVSSL